MGFSTFCKFLAFLEITEYCIGRFTLIQSSRIWKLNYVLSPVSSHSPHQQRRLEREHLSIPILRLHVIGERLRFFHFMVVSMPVIVMWLRS
jgi:hypothetical protein